MEVDCYCEHTIETTGVNTEDIFDEENGRKTISRIRDNNRVTIYGNTVVTINMDLVTVVEEKDDMLVFHFVNNAKIIVHKNGDIEYTTNNMPQTVISHKEL